MRTLVAMEEKGSIEPHIIANWHTAIKDQHILVDVQGGQLLSSWITTVLVEYWKTFSWFFLVNSKIP